MSSDIHALSGAYAVDALDDTERAQFERHLAVCSECRAEVRSLQETAALMTEAETMPAPASLRVSVLAGISQVRPFPPETADDAAPAGARGGGAVLTLRRRLPLLVAAAAVVLLAMGAVVWQPWHHHQQTVADQVLGASDAQRVTERVPGGGKLTLVRSASLNRAVMVGADVPEPPAGKTYELWLQQPGEQMEPAGLMPDSHEPTVLMGDAGTAVAAAVSVEPDGGSSHPSDQVVAVFKLGSGPGKSGA
ncbi:MAG: anti-sigma factor [Nocardioides sp.]